MAVQVRSSGSRSHRYRRPLSLFLATTPATSEPCLTRPTSQRTVLPARLMLNRRTAALPITSTSAGCLGSASRMWPVLPGWHLDSRLLFKLSS